MGWSARPGPQGPQGAHTGPEAPPQAWCAHQGADSRPSVPCPVCPESGMAQCSRTRALRRPRGMACPARRHLPAPGHPVPAAVVTGGTHGHLLAAQCPREADPEVLGVAELGFGLRDLRATVRPPGSPAQPALRAPAPRAGPAGGHSPASPARLRAASAAPACPAAASPQTRRCGGSPWGSRSPG